MFKVKFHVVFGVMQVGVCMLKMSEMYMLCMLCLCVVLLF